MEKRVPYTAAIRALRQSQEPTSLDLDDLNQRATIPTKEGWDVSIPICLVHGSRGSHKFLRIRTKGDELAAKATPHATAPTARAIMLANALKVEAILMTGEYHNAAEFARAIGVSKKHISKLLCMLNMDVSEMERILFETRSS